MDKQSGPMLSGGVCGGATLYIVTCLVFLGILLVLAGLFMIIFGVAIQAVLIVGILLLVLGLVLLLVALIIVILSSDCSPKSSKVQNDPNSDSKQESGRSKPQKKSRGRNVHPSPPSYHGDIIYPSQEPDQLLAEIT